MKPRVVYVLLATCYNDLLADHPISWVQLKNELQQFTLVIGLLCLGGTYIKYDVETAVSYAGGLTGALIYLRMLSSSVDNLGASGGKAAARCVISGPILGVLRLFFHFLPFLFFVLFPLFPCVLASTALPFASER